MHPVQQEQVPASQTVNASRISTMTYLVAVDLHSKWLKVISFESTTLKMILSIHGISETLVSDYGTQFASYQFPESCSKRSIKHVGITPCHPQSNGQAECFVDTLKQALLNGRRKD